MSTDAEAIDEVKDNGFTEEKNSQNNLKIHEKARKSKLRTHERAWIFTFIGFGIGAGILYLGIPAGKAGCILFLLTFFVAYSLGYIAQKYFINLLIEAENSNSLPNAIKFFTGKFVSKTWILIYAFAVFSTLLAYAAGINSLLGDAFLNFGITKTNISIKPLFPSILMIILTLVMLFNDKLLIAILEKLTIFLLFALIIVSVLLIPTWNFSLITKFDFNMSSVISNVAFLVPMIIYTGVLIPALGTMVNFFKREYPELTKNDLNKVCSRNFRISYWILGVIFIVFTISCIMALTPESLDYASKNNISVLAAMESRGGSSYLAFLKLCGILITFLGLITSYYACGFGFIAIFASCSDWWKIPFEKKKKLVTPFIGVILWICITFNFSVINIIGMLITPCIGYMYYILPGIIIRVRPELAIYRRRMNYVIICLGGFLIVSYFIGLAMQ